MRRRSHVDYLYAFDGGITGGEFDAILDLEDTQSSAAANDYNALFRSQASNSIIFDQGGYTWIATLSASGYHYLAIAGTSAANIGNNSL